MRRTEEEHLVRALKEQINLDREVEELKNQLSFRHDFNAEDAFRILDKRGRGYLSKFEFELSLNDIGSHSYPSLTNPLPPQASSPPARSCTYSSSATTVTTTDFYDSVSSLS